MDNVIKFLKLRVGSNEISIRDLERVLGIRQSSIRLKEGLIPLKHLEALKVHLTERYGYSDEVALLEGNEDNPLEPVLTRRVYNLKGVPKFRTKDWRYKDKENGLWKRVFDWHGVNDKKTGRLELREQWQPKDDIIHDDKVGDYYNSRNGNNVYISYRK